MRKQIQDQQINDIIKKYQSGASLQDIAQEFNIHKGSIGRILRRNNIERNKCVPVSDDKIKYIIEKYTSGISSEILAAELNLDGSTVCRILKRNDIKIRPAEENKRKYDINENFFESIDTEEKAYWLGFLYADGSLSKRGYSIRIGLHPQDREILEKFSNIIYGFTKIGIDTGMRNGINISYPYVAVYSKKMHNDLTKLGCSNKKSFTITFPDFLSDELLQHFIRGYFDGDGCISIANENRPAIDITSAKPFLDGLSCFIDKKLGIRFNKMGQRHKDRETNTRNIQLNTFDMVQKFLDYLYKDATIFLRRKYDKYKQIPILLENKENNKINRKTVFENEKYGNISLYGTTYIPSFNGNLLTSNNIKSLTKEEKTSVIDFLFDFYRSNGFPYTKFSKTELMKDFTFLKNFNINSIYNGNIIKLINPAGINIFKNFSPHFFEVKSYEKRKPSIVEAFTDDKLLEKVIKNRVDKNYNMTGNMLKQGLGNSKIAFKASIFFPTVAKVIYSKYTQENDIIYDYSMGFGQRLLGALSLNYKVKYVGADPLKQSVDSNLNIFNFMNENIPGLNKEVDIRCCGSEEFLDEQYIGKIKLAFSSPPYFNIEQYSDDSSQAYHNNDYCYFINEYWRKTVFNIDKMLTNDGIFAINVKENVLKFNLAEDMNNIIKSFGFELCDMYKMQLTRNIAFGKRKEHKYEPIFIFKRKP